MGSTTGTATIVLTDLVGSTALRSQLGERAADELRRDHDAALTAAVSAHRGRVVKGAGDGILAAFDSASDGVAAAVAMQQAVHELGRRRRLRAGDPGGVSAGDVSWEDGDCFGLPVVEAARLEAAASPGQILCAEIVRALARGRASVEFGPAASLSLKGLTTSRSPRMMWSGRRPLATGGDAAGPLVRTHGRGRCRDGDVGARPGGCGRRGAGGRRAGDRQDPPRRGGRRARQAGRRDRSGGGRRTRARAAPTGRSRKWWTATCASATRPSSPTS